jgi:hypothetical protein
MSSTIRLRQVKKIVIIVCFVSMACCIFEMASVAILETFLRKDRNTGTRARHLLRLLQNVSVPSPIEFVTSLLMFQHEQPFGQGTEKGHPAPRESFQFQLSLKNFLNRWHTRQEVVRK